VAFDYRVKPDWSREDISTIRLGSFWGDTAEEIAYLLSRDVDAVLQKAAELAITLKRLDLRNDRQARTFAKDDAAPA
jgi:hypothetical protein